MGYSNLFALRLDYLMIGHLVLQYLILLFPREVNYKVVLALIPIPLTLVLVLLYLFLIPLRMAIFYNHQQLRDWE